jgi:hypothetical protein
LYFQAIIHYNQLTMSLNNSAKAEADPSAPQRVFWRVEGSLLNLTAVRPAGFFTWNAQSFLERWTRRGTMAFSAVVRPILYLTNRKFATRVLHTVLRGVSRDRLDLLGEEYFWYRLRPQLKQRGVEELRKVQRTGAEIVFVSQGLDHVMRPLACHLGVEKIISNRLDFRGGLATGRLLEPVIRPRGPFARLTGGGADGRVSCEKLIRSLGFGDKVEILEAAVQPAKRIGPRREIPVAHFQTREGGTALSVPAALRGRQILLIGGTGFIGKVWLAQILSDLPGMGRIYLLVRRNRSKPSFDRFQKIVEESPVFEKLAERHGKDFGEFLRGRLEVVEGDVSQPDLGFTPEVKERLANSIDLVVNSSGLTEFNPDLRDALAMNVRATTHVLNFLAASRHAALLHLSTCYVVGRRDGRVLERLPRDYTPLGIREFNAKKEWESLEAFVRDTEARAESPEVAEEFRRQAVGKEHAAKDLHGAALENQIRKNRVRWLRQTLTDAATRRAAELGWPNTYTFTKSLSESLIGDFLEKHPRAAVAVVRPAIVESSITSPFRGWNEGINTSASLSYLLGTFFRQLPTNENKCLDLIPVDLVGRGLTLIAAALVERRHERVYQLATSASNPCNMRRSIELTGLGHRKFYRSQNGLRQRIRLQFDAIPVSKARYERLSAPAQKMIVQAINRSVEPLRFVRPPLVKRERELEKVIKLVALFEPFILENDHIFEASHIERLNASLPEEERETFGYDSRSLDWWDYWINVHIPALRKWCYPLIEGRQLEERPRRSVALGPPEASNRAEAAGASPARTS